MNEWVECLNVLLSSWTETKATFVTDPSIGPREEHCHNNHSQQWPTNCAKKRQNGLVHVHSKVVSQERQCNRKEAKEDH